MSTVIPVLTLDADTALLLRERDASLEDVWASFLKGLDAFHRRILTNPAYGRELIWHDLFCSGEWTWEDLVEALRTAAR